jgi:hypothetical protein
LEASFGFGSTGDLYGMASPGFQVALAFEIPTCDWRIDTVTDSVVHRSAKVKHV